MKEMKLINGILKYEDCPHCGNEWEYQCFECEKEELNKLEHLEQENNMHTEDTGE
jgi:formate dehydrogenase maturation protein FdhE